MCLGFFRRQQPLNKDVTLHAWSLFCTELGGTDIQSKKMRIIFNFLANKSLYDTVQRRKVVEVHGRWKIFKPHKSHWQITSTHLTICTKYLLYYWKKKKNKGRYISLWAACGSKALPSVQAENRKQIDTTVKFFMWKSGRRACVRKNWTEFHWNGK